VSRVVLVAFEIEDVGSHTDAQDLLIDALPAAGGAIESWWIAEDIRVDGSDCDSAVFVNRGRQHEAFLALRAAGLSDYYNRPAT
jgi:hypothetical protein